MGIETDQILGRSRLPISDRAVDRHVQDQESGQNLAPRAETMWTQNLGNCPCHLQQCVLMERAKDRHLPVPFYRLGRSANQEWHDIKQEFEGVNLVRFHRTVFARGLWRQRVAHLTTTCYSSSPLPRSIPCTAHSPRNRREAWRNILLKFVRDGAKMGDRQGVLNLHSAETEEFMTGGTPKDDYICFTSLLTTATRTCRFLTLSY